MSLWWQTPKLTRSRLSTILNSALKFWGKSFKTWTSISSCQTLFHFSSVAKRFGYWLNLIFWPYTTTIALSRSFRSARLKSWTLRKFQKANLCRSCRLDTKTPQNTPFKSASTLCQKVSGQCVNMAPIRALFKARKFRFWRRDLSQPSITKFLLLSRKRMAFMSLPQTESL